MTTKAWSDITSISLSFSIIGDTYILKNFKSTNSIPKKSRSVWPIENLVIVIRSCEHTLGCKEWRR